MRERLRGVMETPIQGIIVRLREELDPLSGGPDRNGRSLCDVAVSRHVNRPTARQQVGALTFADWLPRPA